MDLLDRLPDDVPAPDHSLWAENTPWCFWKLLQQSEISAAEWEAAAREALPSLAGLPLTFDTEASFHGFLGLLAQVLGEEQFGPDHWKLNRAKSLYYATVRSLLPRPLRLLLRGRILVRQKRRFPLNWPIEDRFVRFLFEILGQLMDRRGLDRIPYLHFWPRGAAFAFVSTHDVETVSGQRFVPTVATLEESLGFRSSFNFVPEGYAVDRGLLRDLRDRGFEVGVHGLRHDGRLFSSETTFTCRAARVNRYLAEWGAVGFRSPFTHRHPAWMQRLDVEYDSSFFDTDPFETIPGGTMSIWPFRVGRFVELPCTLAQDHTLTATLGETTPRLWQEKVEFIRGYGGMALMNTHPDYLSAPKTLAIYETFLRWMRERDDYWAALPCEAARWWRRRAAIQIRSQRGEPIATSCPEVTIGEVRRVGRQVRIVTRSNEITGALALE